MLGHFSSGDGSAGNLDHSSNGVFQLALLETKLLANFSCSGIDDILLKFKLTCVGHEWDHDLRENLGAFLLHLMSSLEDSLNLHCGDSRIADPKAATAMTKHWVLLVKSVDTLGNGRSAHADLLGEILLLSGIHRADEFVKRWIQKTDGGRAAFE